MDKAVLSIIIPLYNEAESLGETIPEIERHVRSTAIPYEVILVDDGSTDATWDLIAGLFHNRQEIRAIRLSRNFGKEAAISTGLEFAAGKAAVVMDGDLQHPPGLIPEMVSIWQSGEAEIVEAVKADRGQEPLLTRFRAKLFYWLMGRLTGMDLDNSSDFKLLDRKAIDAHNRLPESSRFFRGIVSWLGFRTVRIPFAVQERIRGRSGWSVRQLVRLAMHASTTFSSLPLHLITVMGFITLGISVLLGVQTLYRKLSGTAVSGFSTVILLLLFIGSVLMLSLGIIGVYLARIFEEVKRRPRYIVAQTLNLPPRQ